MSNNNNSCREISMTGQFKRDVKKHCSELISKEGIEILGKLIRDLPLPEKYSDHKLSHNWADCRDCHIRPDLVLIYRKTKENVLQLIRLGTHSELFK
ncbi:type II toxin-antitoxin system YafQ family toxin [Eikenella sp. NML01-A-086]|uniref:type II toxin-antitoxin system YafQ family toxin n=1 Tax=Eikenella sp. NML01-A-086 TaxID=1795826 RepID=UPI0009EEDE73|nr:type II toxin-antitoxin system YafQ family toxin [Eikenella sp. NML01-A-086]